MILSFAFQLKTLILAVLVGFIMGFFYDWIRVFRRILFHKNIIIQIEDVIYWNFMACAIFLISLYQNNGEIRVFFISGILIGMCTYFFTVSKLFINISNKVISFIKKVLIFIFNCVLIPFKILLKTILFVFMPVLKFFNKIIKSIKKLLQNNKKCVKIYNKLKNIKSKKLGDKDEEKK